MVENQEFYSDVKIGAHHYAELFAENGYEVLWLSPAYSLLHYANNFSLTKKRSELNKPERVELKKNIYGYSPFSLIPFIKAAPFNSEFIAKNYLYSSIPGIRKQLKALGFDEVDILWISNIKMLYMKEFLSYKKLVHRLSDEKTGFKGFYQTLSDMESDLIRESDIVYATAQKLVEKTRRVREDVIYLPNGVNYEDFQKNEYQMPEEFKKYTDKKKCIYIGAIAEWLDKDLIEHTVKTLPDVQFFFIGPNHGGSDELQQFENVHFLGKRKYSTLPDYLYYSDVAMIPFKINALTDAINPVKLFEYLSVGTPTVTTNFKEVEYIKGPFEVADSKEAFVSCVNKVITESPDKELLRKFAQENDWKGRFKVIEASLIES